MKALRNQAQRRLAYALYAAWQTALGWQSTVRVRARGREEALECQAKQYGCLTAKEEK